MKTYAFIFARGGSKGLPGKNIMPLAGKPLLGHAIELALGLKEISRVFVSTDDAEIAEVARKYNAEVILRPKNLATDDSPELESWKHAVKKLFDEEDKFDRFISLPTTAPLRTAEDIRNSLDKFDHTTDLVVTVTESQRNPYFNMVKLDEKGFIKILSEDNNSYSRRQDLPLCYDLTTVAYVSSPQYILSTDNLFKGKVKAAKIPKERAVDIDDMIDFMLAELIFKSNK